MSNIYDKSSLVLIPSGTKSGKVFSQKPVSGDGDFTFTRSSAATRVNADGNIEKETQNLLLQSNSFDTTWVSSNTTETGGQSGYDGTSDAWLLTKSAAYANLNQSVSASGVNTYSLYAKANSLSWLRIVGGSTSAFFDLSNGVVGTTDAGNIAKMTSIGSGWYRCEVAMNASTTIMRIYPAQADNDVTGTSGSIYIQDAQLEQGLVARDYIETTTSAVEGGITDNVPRLDYTDSSCPALLLEPQRSNLLPYSEYFSGWTSKSRIYHTNGANATTSPESLSNGWKITGDGTAGQHYVLQSANYTSGTTYTCSVFAKADTHDYIQLILGATPFSSTNYCNYDLSDGSIGTTGSTISDEFIEDYGDGWYRIGFSATAASTGSGNFFPTLVTSSSATFFESNSTTGSVFLYGAQVEAGSYATSYIPTYGSSVTRVADATIKSAISDLIGQTEGTIFIEFDAEEDAPQNMNLINFNNSTQASVLIAKRTSGALRAQVFAGGSAPVDINSAIVSGKTKAAIAYKSGDSILYVNGVGVSDSSTFTFNGTLSEVIFPSHQAYFNYGHKYSVNQALLFKTRLSNEELADLTTL
jgi:hypothetical protein